jgi:tripartite-type tricarboxylate transporter receptor subunit TctC
MPTIRTIASATLAVFAGVVSASAVSAADGIADFYKGKQLRMIIGSGSGGGYDTYARLVARHLGRHIPGNPSIISQNMDGAGSIIATNYMVNAAPADGTVIGGLQRSAALVQLMGKKGPKFRAAELHWLGSLAKEAAVCAVATRTGVTSLEDVFRRQFVMGGTGANQTEFHPALFNNLMGAKFKLIRGYPGSSHVHLALQRGEVDGICQSWASFKELSGERLKRGEIKALVQVALQPDPEMQKMGVPMLSQFLTPDHTAPGLDVADVKTLFNLTLAPGVMGRPFAVAPKVPAARVKALRTAFVAMTKDPQFLADAKKMHRDIELVTGDEIQAIIADLAKTSKDKLVALDDHLKFKGQSQMAKLEVLRHTGKVLESQKGGRKIVIDYKGRKASASVSGSRTRVTIDGVKAKRGKVTAGMTCTLVYFGSGTRAKELNCRN